MRIAAGILMMVTGFTPLGLGGLLGERFGQNVEGILAVLGLLLAVLIWAGAASAFMRRHWKWAIGGALCSVLVSLISVFFGTFGLVLPLLLALLSMLAFYFLTKRKQEFKDHAA